jgi:hypothetical protein
MTCTNQNKTFTKSPNEMSSTQAYNKNNIIKNNINKNNINKNTLNKMNDRANDRVYFVGNQMPTAHNPYDANIILEQKKAYEQGTEKINDKILELKNYVDAMIQTNTIDNQNNSGPSFPSLSSTQSSLAISQKYTQKEMDRMIKIMPSINGDEKFEI